MTSVVRYHLRHLANAAVKPKFVKKFVLIIVRITIKRNSVIFANDYNVQQIYNIKSVADVCRRSIIFFSLN